VTRARPKIGAYPFTTLHPNLGVAMIHDQEIILCDIPGLIEHAHEGAGLGDRFLGHIERCFGLLHLIDGTSDDVVRDYQIIRKELEAYGGNLDQKTEIIGLNKIDSLLPEEVEEKMAELRKTTHHPICALSSLGKQGLQEVLYALGPLVVKEESW
jgi:GTP-binding protein